MSGNIIRAGVCAISLICCAGLSRAEGLVAHYKLSRGRGTVAHNSVTPKKSGKIVSATWSKIKNDAALKFDGKSSYVDCGSGKRLGLKNQYTLSAWILPAGQLTGEAIIVGEGTRYYAMTYYKNHVYAYVASGGNSVRAYAAPGKLYHAAATFDGNTLSLYLNGKLAAAKKLDAGISIPTQRNLMIGGGYDGFYRGLIQDVRIYGRSLSYDEILALAAAPGEEEAAKMEAVVEKLFDNIPVWHDSPKIREYLLRHQPTNWGGSSSGNLSEFNTPELAITRAAEIKAGGYTAAIINGRQNRLNHLQLTDQIVKFHRTVAEACHAQGLKVLDHLDFTIFWHAAYPVIFEHPEWAQQDLRDGSHTRWCCLNNPGYMEFYAQYLEKLTDAGIDGFQLDEISFHDQRRTFCGCEYCREKFARETGFHFPEFWDAEIIDNRAHPFWRLWLEWQKKCLVEAKSFLLGRIRKINPDVFLLSYNTAIYRTSVRVQDIQNHARVSFVGTEGTNLVYPGAFNFFAQYRILSSFARQYGRPAWAHGATNNPEEEDFAAFLIALTANGSTWTNAQVFRWAHWQEARAWGKPVADIGVLLVSPSRDGDVLQGDLHSAETLGWCEALGVGGVQFETVPCLSATLADLQQYRAIVLPHPVNMPRRLIATVRQYVEQGGTAVVTGVPGRYDLLGSPLGENSFLRSMGFREIVAADKMVYVDPAYYGRNPSAGGVDRALLVAPGRFQDIPLRIAMLKSYRFNVSFDEGIRPEVWARFEDNAPAIVSIPSGKGRYVYLALLPAYSIHQPRLLKSYLWGRYLQPEMAALLRAIAQDATGGQDHIVVEGKGILSASYRKDNRVWVRMLNVAGIELPEGKPIGAVVPLYPDLGPIRICLRIPVKPEVQLVSPDREEATTLTAVREGRQMIITVPEKAFKRFAFIRMEALQ